MTVFKFNVPLNSLSEEKKVFLEKNICEAIGLLDINVNKMTWVFEPEFNHTSFLGIHKIYIPAHNSLRVFLDYKFPKYCNKSLELAVFKQKLLKKTYFLSPEENKDFFNNVLEVSYYYSSEDGSHVCGYL